MMRPLSIPGAVTGTHIKSLRRTLRVVGACWWCDQTGSCWFHVRVFSTLKGHLRRLYTSNRVVDHSPSFATHFVLPNLAAHQGGTSARIAKSTANTAFTFRHVTRPTLIQLSSIQTLRHTHTHTCGWVRNERLVRSLFVRLGRQLVQFSSAMAAHEVPHRASKSVMCQSSGYVNTTLDEEGRRQMEDRARRCPERTRW